MFKFSKVKQLDWKHCIFVNYCKEINASPICYQFITRRVIKKLQRAQTCNWVVWQLTIFLDALVTFGDQTCQLLFPISDLNNVLSEFVLYIKKKIISCNWERDLYVMWINKEKCCKCQRIWWPQNVSRYIYFFQLCLWKPKKKKSQHILVSFEYTDWPKHRHSLYQSYCYKNCTLQTV